MFGAKPLPELVLAYCRLDSWEQVLVKFKKMHLKLLSAKIGCVMLESTLCQPGQLYSKNIFGFI